VSDDSRGTATAVTVITGERYEIEGSPDQVEQTIIAASRGSIMQLAWMRESGSGRKIGINPKHVTAIEPT
jgi:hypothetical protein